MIDTVVFDMAKVLLAFDRDYVISCFYKGKDTKLLREKLFVGWEDLDEDLISVKDYEDKIAFSLPKRLQPVARKILNNWENTMFPTDGIVNFIKELKEKGCRLYVLSNMTRHFIENDFKFPFLSLFDGIVYSAPIKMVKPNPDIFQYLIDKYSLNPENCLFVDDRKENLATGARFKMKTFLFNDNVDELKEYFNSLNR